MKLFKSKKGFDDYTPDTFPFWIIFLLVTSITTIIMVWIITSWLTDISEIPDGVEDRIIIDRFLNSNECFAYFDEDTGRTFQNVIDWNKLTEKQMQNCYQSLQLSNYAYKIELSFGEETKKLPSPNYSEGKIIRERLNADVFIKSGENYIEGKVFINVQEAK